MVALKGGVRGGHSAVSKSATSYQRPPHQPLGLSPADYICSGSEDLYGAGISSGGGGGLSPDCWPKGMTNVGNTCYANAALQCLLSTALTSALLDPKTIPILRRYSSNPNLLAMGSGSVDSSEESSQDGTNGNTCDEEGTVDYSVGVNIADEEDGIFLDGNGVTLSKSFLPPTPPEVSSTANLKSIAASLKKSSTSKEEKKRLKKAQRKKKKEERRAKAEDAVKRKERERRRMEDNCKWLTTEMTGIAHDYMLESSTSSSSSVGRKGTATTGARSCTGPSSSSVMGWLSSSYSQTLSGVQQPEELHGVVDPGSITRYPNRLSPCLSPYQQEDAHEFMRALLSTLVMNGQNRQLSSLFDGLLESSVTCQTCGRASLTRDRYMDLSVDINDGGIQTLDDALFEFTKDELLTEDNAVFCQKCRQKRSVTKGLRLATAPSILVCHLKRFAFNDYGRLVRLHKRIEFPQKLEIGDYMSNLNKARPPPYDLVGVLVHQGQTCASGHYLSFVKKNGEWFKCNDSEITKVEESVVMNQQAYILMYEVAEMRANACFLPKPLRKEASLMSTIESGDDATLSKGDFSTCTSYQSASDKSGSSRRSTAAIGSYSNPFGSNYNNRNMNHEESATESMMRVLREVGVTRFISDYCCETSGITEPETRVLNDTSMHNRSRTYDKNTGYKGRKRSNNKYAHECESVDTQDSLIRRRALMNRTPINVLEVQPRRKSSRRNHRSQTAPRQRADSLQESAFQMVTPFSTLTPRANGGGKSGKHGTDGVFHRTFLPNENHSRTNDAGSISSRSTCFETDSITSKRRYNMNNDEDLLPPRNSAAVVGRHRGSGNSSRTSRRQQQLSNR